MNIVPARQATMDGQALCPSLVRAAGTEKLCKLCEQVRMQQDGDMNSPPKLCSDNILKIVRERVN